MNGVSTKTGNPTTRAQCISGLVFSTLLMLNTAANAASPLILGAAGDYAVLAKSGISTVPPSAVTGNIGVSPIDSTAITGFSLIMDSSGQFSTSSQVTGRAYAPDYASPTPVNLTTAVSDMETAYTDAAGRTLPDYTKLGSGNIGGMTLAPGLYKWSTGVTIPTDVTLTGGPDEVWIFQIAGNLNLAGATSVHLSGGAEARNVFWQVAGGVGVDLGTSSHLEGTVLSQAGISLQSGASINGRLLAQTAVTLQANAITVTVPPSMPVMLRSAAVVTGPYTDAAGQIVDAATKTITVPQSGNQRFYQIWSASALTATNIHIMNVNVVIQYN